MKKLGALIIILAAVYIIVFASGCTGTHNTIDEPDITAEYLSGEYAAQLVRDGALVIFGSIEIIEDEDGTILVYVDEKEYVEDADQPNGFYIADKNLDSTYQLSYESRATFLPGGSSTPEAMYADEFVGAATRDNIEFGADNPGYSEYKLYDIYIMGDQIELLIARYIP